jgi:hypothetical protein
MRTQRLKTNQRVRHGDNGSYILFSNAKRLELGIVAAALLVLLLCSRPPRSGNADTLPDNLDLTTRMPSWPNEPQAAVATAPQDLVQNTPDMPSADSMPPAEMPPRTKRIGIVDARNCDKLNYRDVMYGDVSVRWVWDGQKLAPQKVCVVPESNSVSSVWSFSQHNDVTLSERQEEIANPQ